MSMGMLGKRTSNSYCSGSNAVEGSCLRVEMTEELQCLEVEGWEGNSLLG